MADFKVNYRGAGIIQDFDYICKECGYTGTIAQKRSEDMDKRRCPECKKKRKKVFMLRHITKAPALDADFHYNCHSSNIGSNPG